MSKGRITKIITESEGEMTNLDRIQKARTALDGIESLLREVWPDGKPVPTDDDEESDLYWTLVTMMVHITDLRFDLEQAIDYVQ